MTVYIILFAAILGASFLPKIKIVDINGGSVKGSTIYWLFVFGSVVLVEALRDSSVGIDLPYYIQFFKNSGNLTFDRNYWVDFSAIEPGYNFLNYILFSISKDPRFFIFATSLIIVFLHIFFLYKNSIDFPVSVLLFFGFDYFFTSMVSIRQFIAMGFVFWCYPAALEKNYRKFSLFALLAFYFHQSSVVCAFLIFVSVIFKNQKKLIKWIFIVAMMLVPAILSIFSYIASFFHKYESFYLAGNFETGLGKLRIVYIIMQIVLVIYSIIKHKDDRDERTTSMSILLIVGIYLGLGSAVIPFAFRMGFYFDYFMLLYIPEILNSECKYTEILRVGIVFISVMFFGYYLSVNPGLTVPYVLYHN